MFFTISLFMTLEDFFSKKWKMNGYYFAFFKGKLTGIIHGPSRASKYCNNEYLFFVFGKSLLSNF